MKPKTQQTAAAKVASAKTRVAVSASVGTACGLLAGALGFWTYAPLAAWDIAGGLFVIWALAGLLKKDAAQTEHLATREDPGTAEADVVLVFASIASLAAIAILLLQTSGSSLLPAALTVVSVAVSWAVVHTLYTLRYARMYYQHGGGIDFNCRQRPSYSDFAYLAFVVGMTFQVADTNLKTPQLRKTVLRHALLSYLFGTVIVASVINLVVGLGK